MTILILFDEAGGGGPVGGGITTAAKRMSALGYDLPFARVWPLADGSVNTPDRAQCGYKYRLAAEDSVVPDTTILDDGGRFWGTGKKKKKKRKLVINQSVQAQVEEIVDVGPYIRQFYDQIAAVEAERVKAEQFALRAREQQQAFEKAREEAQARFAMEVAEMQFQKLMADIRAEVERLAAVKRRKMKMIITIVLNEED